MQTWLDTYNTSTVQADPVQWRVALNKAVLYALMAPFDYDSNEILQLLKADKRLQKLPEAYSAVVALTSEELISWPVQHEAHWRSDDLFTTPDLEEVEDPEDRRSSDSAAMADDEPAAAEKPASSSTSAPMTKDDPWAVFRKRIVQHNIRIISKYFKRIRSSRLAELLQLDIAVSHLSQISL